MYGKHGIAALLLSTYLQNGMRDLFLEFKQDFSTSYSSSAEASLLLAPALIHSITHE